MYNNPMTNYTTDTLNLLQGDTPKQKYESLVALIAAATQPPANTGELTVKQLLELLKGYERRHKLSTPYIRIFSDESGGIVGYVNTTIADFNSIPELVTELKS